MARHPFFFLICLWLHAATADFLSVRQRFTGVYAEVDRSVLSRSFVVNVMVDDTFIEQSSFASPAQTSFHLKLSQDERHIYYIRENLSLRSTDPEMEKALKDGIADDIASVISVGKQGQKLMFSISDLLLNGFHVYSPGVKQVSLWPDIEVNNYDTNVHIRIQYKLQGPVVTYHVMLLPEKVMAPRVLDDRIGYQHVKFTDFGIHHTLRGPNGKQYIEAKHVDPVRRMITRHNLEVDAEGNVVNPIKFYVGSDVDQTYHQVIKYAILSWNIALEKNGMRRAIEYAFHGDPNWPSNLKVKLHDFRFNTITISHSKHVSSTHNIVDPRSGEILGSKIIIGLDKRTTEYLQYILKRSRPSKFTFTEKQVPQTVVRQSLMLELGRALGLAPNLRATQTYSPKELQTGQSNGYLSSSIMDYIRLNLWTTMLLDNSKISLDQLFQSKLGTYDMKAIAYGYKKILNEQYGLLAPELEMLAKGIEFYGQSDIQPNHVNMQADLSSNPVAFHIDELHMVKHLQTVTKPGYTVDHVFLLERAFGAAENLAAFVGGLAPTKLKSPSKAIPKDQQQLALKTVVQVITGSSEILAYASEMLRKYTMDYLVDRVINMHSDSAPIPRTAIMKELRETLWSYGPNGYCPDAVILEYHIKHLAFLTGKHDLLLSTLGQYELNALKHQIKGLKGEGKCRAVDKERVLDQIQAAQKDFPSQPRASQLIPNRTSSQGPGSELPGVKERKGDTSAGSFIRMPQFFLLVNILLCFSRLI